ncbi:hypothetical protein EON79_08395 [bacterium]|nr:MAG: hypothetical protein EON79_08395 [bacterium]
MVALFAALILAKAETPLDRLPGKWTSLETLTKGDGSKATLRLKGENRWIYPGELLEISESYRIDGEKEDGNNHILIRLHPDGKMTMWWHVPKAAKPLTFEGTSDEKGLVFTQDNGRLRISYMWDGKDDYDAKLEVKAPDKAEWQSRTVARYTRQK